MGNPSFLGITATDAIQAEGNSGLTAFTFTVTRSGNVAVVTSVNYSVTGSGANAATASDFVGGALPAGTVTFAAGETSKLVTVNVAGDTALELNEGFTVTLSNETGDTVILATQTAAVGSILNDDAQTTLSIAATDAVKAEGNSGLTPFTFTVTRSGDTSGASSANWAVTGSGASPAAAGDFTGGALPTGTVSFAAGQTSKVVTVNVAGDVALELNESFNVTLSGASGAVLGASTATGTIQNDDTASTLAISGPLSLSEGNSGSTAFTYTVTRSGDTTGATSVNYAVTGSGGNPGAASDFTGGTLPGGTVSFAAGETSKLVTINVAGDTAFEANEGFTVTLSGATAGAAISNGATTGTILNDDAAPPLNIVPVAGDDSYAFHANGAFSVAAPGLLANDSDGDGDTLNITSVDTTGLQGTLTAFADGRFDFTPTAGFVGATSFSYTITDGFGGTDTATVTLNVLNATPAAGDDSYAFHTNGAFSVTAPGLLANDSDGDGDTLNITSVNTTGLQGTLAAFADGRFDFTPTAGFVGATSFSYTVADGFGGTDTATVTLNVLNATPAAGDDSYAFHTNGAFSVTAPGLLANDSDGDGDPLNITSVNTTGLQGTLAAFADGRFDFTPTAGFIGTTSFSYTIADGFGGTDTATVTLNVLNATPAASDDSFTVSAGQMLSVTAPGLLANDTDGDGDPLSITSVNTTGLQGALTAFADGRFDFTPTAGFVGTTSFSYTVTDGFGGADTATVSVKVGNSAPVGLPGSATTPEDTALAGIVTASDDEGDSLTFSKVSDPSHGSLTLAADGSYVYTPTLDYNGPDAFTYQAFDGETYSAPVTISLTVSPINDAPVAMNDSASTSEKQAVTIDVLANDVDVDSNDTRVLVSVDASTVGSTISISLGKIVYTPGPQFDLLSLNQSATETFSYVMQDGAGAQSTATVTVTVMGTADGAAITGSRGDVAGTTADEHISAGNGVNTVHGMGGADTITGGNGADKLFGDAGFDILRGGNGADALDGGVGDDRLEGGNGPDVFVFAGLGFGHDVILDFDNADRIQFSTLAIPDYDAAMAHAVQLGADVLITLDANSTVLIKNLSLATLNSGDFLFS